MSIDPRLHHYAQKITKGSLDTVLEMYEELDCNIKYRPDNKFCWAMVGQDGLHFIIQVVEYDEEPISDVSIKRGSHVVFLSDDPQDLVNKVKDWADRKGIKFIQGGWSKKELYFDLSDIFVNFVVEVMHTSIEDE